MIKPFSYHDIRATRVVEVAADVADAFCVHDVHVLVFAEKLPGRGELGLRGRQLGLGRGCLHVGVEAPEK